MLATADFPDDVAALKAMLIAVQVREAAKDVQIVRKDERIERLEKLVAAFKQAAFGRKSEKTDAEQFDLWTSSRRSSASSSPVGPSMRAVPAPTASSKPPLQHG